MSLKLSNAGDWSSTIVNATLVLYFAYVQSLLETLFCNVLEMKVLRDKSLHDHIALVMGISST